MFGRARSIPRLMKLRIVMEIILSKDLEKRTRRINSLPGKDLSWKVNHEKVVLRIRYNSQGGWKGYDGAGWYRCGTTGIKIGTSKGDVTPPSKITLNRAR